MDIWGYCDSSHLTCPDIGRSREAYAFVKAGGGVLCPSKLLPNATLSSVESEYKALPLARQEASFLKGLQIEIERTSAMEKPVQLLMDSHPAIDILYFGATGLATGAGNLFVIFLNLNCFRSSKSKK